ncbi:MAG: hypothetical protein QXU54_02285 [Candidatus Micrarchaeia archaeon]
MYGLKSLKPEKMKHDHTEAAGRNANAFRDMFEKVARRAKAAAGAAALGAAIALAPSCSGRMDLSQYEATDSIEVPDNEAIPQCVPNTKVAYRAVVSIGGVEKNVAEGDSVDIEGTRFTVSFRDDGTLVLTDPRGKPYEVGDGAYVLDTLVEVVDRSTDLLAYESRVLASVSAGQSTVHLILGRNQEGQHTVGGVSVKVITGEIESWDYAGDFVPVSVVASLNGEEYGVAGMLARENRLDSTTPAGELAIEAREFVIEQFPAKGVDACDRTSVVAYISTEPNTVSTAEEGSTIALANGASVRLEKVFPTVEGKVAAVELSWVAGGKREHRTLLAGETLSVENENGAASVEFLGATFQTNPTTMQP